MNFSSTGKVITNQTVSGTLLCGYNHKDIQGSAHATVTPGRRTVAITTYQLIKTPDNETGYDVRDGETQFLFTVYRVKNVEERMGSAHLRLKFLEFMRLNIKRKDGELIKAYPLNKV